MTLPTPDPAFHWTTEVWGHALRCEPFEAVAQHAFTSRQLQLRGGPDVHPIRWAQATASVGGDLAHLVRVKQVHGAVVRVLKKGNVSPRELSDTPPGDAIVSNAPGLVLSVQVADCVPILLADARTGAAAAVHAGWRGTCAGVARAAIRVMVREFGTRPADLIAAIGPSIGPCCYTVGQNVVDAFREAGASVDEIRRWFVRSNNVVRLDLWTANHDQLIGAGLNADHVHLARLCTLTHAQVFESYRAEGERAGRMAALVAVPGSG